MFDPNALPDYAVPIAYPIDDVPRLTGIPRRKVFQAAADNLLTVRKCGRTSIIEHDELVRWIGTLPTRGRSPEQATA
jgi:hypothetical protein